MALLRNTMGSKESADSKSSADYSKPESAGWFQPLGNLDGSRNDVTEVKKKAEFTEPENSFVAMSRPIEVAEREREYAAVPVERDVTAPAREKVTVVEMRDASMAEKREIPVYENREIAVANTDTYPVSSDFYLFRFFKGLCRKSNIPVIIYLVINVLIIGGICSFVLSLPFGWGLLSGLILYIASINVALSPIGEWILRRQNACWIIDEVEVVDQIEPLFREVYEQARKECPNISEDIRLYMQKDDSANAFATGRNTICITSGLLNKSDAQIKAILAHEFGHLANMDTDLILVVGVGNLIITGCCMVFQFIVSLFHFILGIGISTRDDGGFMEHVFNAIMYFFTMIIIAAIMKIWTALGTALCMKTRRAREFEADRFAWKIGYGEGLREFLDEEVSDYPAGFFSNLAQSHPRGSDRIEYLDRYDMVA